MFVFFCVSSRYQIVVEIIQATTLSSIPQLKKQKGKAAGSGPFFLFSLRSIRRKLSLSHNPPPQPDTPAHAVCRFNCCASPRCWGQCVSSKDILNVVQKGNKWPASGLHPEGLSMVHATSKSVLCGIEAFTLSSFCSHSRSCDDARGEAFYSAIQYSLTFPLSL